MWHATSEHVTVLQQMYRASSLPDALVAIRHPEEAGELIDNHIGICKCEDGGECEPGPVTELQRSELSFHSETSQHRRQQEDDQ